MDFLKNNAFRILALPATATERETLARLDEVRSMSRIGINKPYPLDTFWPGVCRDPDMIEHAVELLHNPMRRMEQALFWFWEVTEADRRAIQCLEKGDTAAAEKIWREGAENRPGVNNGSAVKNYAQLLTCRMFDPNLPKKEFRRARNRAITLWERLFRSPGLWHKLESFTSCARTKPDHEELSRLFFKSLAAELEGGRRRMVQSRLTTIRLSQAAADNQNHGFECGPDICLEDAFRFLIAKVKERSRNLAVCWEANSVAFAIALVPLTIIISLLVAASNDTHSITDGAVLYRGTVLINEMKKPDVVPAVHIPAPARKPPIVSRVQREYPVETGNEIPVGNTAPDVKHIEPEAINADIQYFPGDETGASVEDAEENEETEVSADQEEQTVEASSDNE